MTIEGPVDTLRLATFLPLTTRFAASVISVGKGLVDEKTLHGTHSAPCCRRGLQGITRCPLNSTSLPAWRLLLLLRVLLQHKLV